MKHLFLLVIAVDGDDDDEIQNLIYCMMSHEHYSFSNDLDLLTNLTHMISSFTWLLSIQSLYLCCC